MAVKQNRILCYNPRTRQYSPVSVSEVLLCVDIELGNDTERGIQLTEQPSFDFSTYPVQVTRDSDGQVFTETVSDTIGATEFLVDYTTGSGNIILNSATSLGESFTVNYFSIGSINTILNILNSGSLADLGDLLAGSRKIQNLADGSIVSSGKDSVTAGQLYTEQQARISGDSGLQTQIDGNDTDIAAILASKGAANGIATLDGSGNVVQSVDVSGSLPAGEYVVVREVLTISPAASSGSKAWANAGHAIVSAVIYENDGAQEINYNLFVDSTDTSPNNLYFRYNIDTQAFEWVLGFNAEKIEVFYVNL